MKEKTKVQDVVFGIAIFYLDVIELILIIYLFIHCLFGPKKINGVK